jgi:hypothetical protein
VSETGSRTAFGKKRKHACSGAEGNDVYFRERKIRGIQYERQQQEGSKHRGNYIQSDCEEI